MTRPRQSLTFQIWIQNHKLRSTSIKILNSTGKERRTSREGTGFLSWLLFDARRGKKGTPFFLNKIQTKNN